MIDQEEYYRLKAEELHIRLKQIRTFVIKHNLTIGLFAEEILRGYLRTILPHKVAITQGFIYGNEQLSKQCDIILYDCLNYTTLFSSGDISVVPAQAVLAVIEVKTSINKKGFYKILSDFSVLNSLGVSQKICFVYNSCSADTIRKYFKPNEFKLESNPTIEIIDGQPYMSSNTETKGYDHDIFYELPEIIIGIKPDKEFYFRKDYIIEDRDKVGYLSLTFKDKTDQLISCLQEFTFDLLDLVTDNNSISSVDRNDIARYESISLFDM